MAYHQGYHIASAYAPRGGLGAGFNDMSEHTKTIAYWGVRYDVEYELSPDSLSAYIVSVYIRDSVMDIYKALSQEALTWFKNDILKKRCIYA